MALIYHLEFAMLTTEIITLFIFIFLQWMIVRRTGLKPWVSLLLLLPIINLFAYLYIATARWPNEKTKIRPD
ncbi:hypothetical protein M975_4159 [Buttiauxella brennerae ATCC 51605]|uniref:Cardiolipin synthase N-terminal domain-containing protein n=1 Tax=Buttiauxella brennerae ATCC 51605 TaxID=1354251 RepID=A0A1B7IE51_9ENTR|nr:hypothetical protein M975_4159 [Buttiauxella brennerae ATCC 51605]